MYIGQTSNLSKRWKTHLSKSSKDKLLFQDIQKYGKDNFDFRIILSLDGHSEILTAERYWIAFYKTNVNKYGDEFGYNLTDGGQGILGLKHSQKTKNKLSEIHTIVLSDDTTNQINKMLSESVSRKIIAKEINITPKTLRKKIGKKLQILSDKQIIDIVSLLIQNQLECNIANIFNVSQHTVSFIKTLKNERVFSLISPEMRQLLGQTKTRVGENNARVVLTNDQVCNIKKLLREKNTVASIARLYSVGESTIRHIKNGNTWKHIR